MNRSRRDRFAITQEALRAFFDYDQLSGVLTYKIGKGARRVAGARAGSVSKDGYRLVKFDGVTIMACHIIWCWMTGKWPENEVDHKNLVRHDDRWENLREASRAQNCSNRRKKVSAYGYRGVRKNKNRFMARIGVEGKYLYLGTYDTAEEAARAYDVGAVKHHQEFAGLNFPAIKRDWLFV